MSVDFDWRVDPDCRSSCQLVHLEDLRCFVPSTVTEAPASVANIAYPTKERKTCFCDQSLLRRVNLPALISNLACLGHKEAIQSLLEERNQFVFTSSSTVVPAHVLADLLECAPCFRRAACSSQGSNFLAGDLE